MKHMTAICGAALLAAGSAQAGGVERSIIGPGILFEDGNYIELSYGNVSPSVSGVTLFDPSLAVGLPAGSLPAGADSGNMAGSYAMPSLALKNQINEKLDFGLLINQPIGADVSYAAGTGYLYGGSTATINATAITAMLRYKLEGGMSVYGGVTAERASGNVALFNGYAMTSAPTTDFGYMIGAAYEKPEIALRVALTYTSAITHDFDATESLVAPAVLMATSYKTEVPQALTLDVQSGVAKDTLVFGSIRWRDWTAFNITPTLYTTAVAPGGALVDYANDSVTLTLGVGRKFNDNWSGAVSITHEDSKGGFAGNLGPTDGYTALGVGLIYKKDNMKISGGVSYAKVGKATTALGGLPFGDFKDNSTVGFGLKVGFSF